MPRTFHLEKVLETGGAGASAWTLLPGHVRARQSGHLQKENDHESQQKHRDVRDHGWRVPPGHERWQGGGRQQSGGREVVAE